ncbi:Asp-tRNA(Asn)/Glu-tRNA(Gln) amidotransferase subunit GatA, partial [Candidatus Wolfebacteria bacterium]|nr:Asp-tRNA(Asn)/Glu-tRNA(Gln) amidotransferase subunit GatA [Candidatus Wolfebacteria bacterium]
GIPIALKDNMVMEGLTTTAGSKILKDYKGSSDSTIVKILKSKDAVILGKTNMDEFAMGSSTENSAFQITKNPHDITRIPGGSSGGSAAAVADGMAVASLGSDTGGSIRQPASLCGLVGLKPTYGSVSRSGLIAMASSLDQIGPFAKTVEDAAIIYNNIRGYDSLDATSDKKSDEDISSQLLKPDFEKIKKLKVGVPNEYFIDGLDPKVGERVQGVINQLKDSGIEIKRMSLPHTKYSLACYYIVMPAEASSNLERFDGIRYGTRYKADNLIELYKNNREEGFGVEPKRRILLGSYVLSSGYYDAYYAKAQKVRKLIANDFANAFDEVDVILSPTTPTPAFKIGEKVDDPLSMYLSDIFTTPANLAGIPAVSIPIKTEGELPVGFQLFGRHWGESDILGLGQYYENLNK